MGGGVQCRFSISQVDKDKNTHYSAFNSDRCVALSKVLKFEEDLGPNGLVVAAVMTIARVAKQSNIAT